MQRPPSASYQAAGGTKEYTAECPSDELLFSLALGELHGAEQESAEEHVRSCPECRAILSEALHSLGGESKGNEDEDKAHRVLLDRYELLEPIGSGGAGVVYRAYDRALKREVAVKILRPDLVGSQDGFQTRLHLEAQATAQFSHPNVVTAYDVGATESGGFIVLEYFSGGTLEQWFHDDHSLSERLRVMREAGQGLAAAHEKGMVHRDFKPQNVLLSEDGRVCVTDFGLARLEDTGDLRGFQMDSTIGDATETRGLMGTPNYMAPEVFAGNRGDEASDQYSFSVALYQALNNRHPFRAGVDVTLAELLTRMRSEVVEPWDPAVPEQVRRVTERGLSAEPHERFSSMSELLAALETKPSRVLTPLRSWMGAILAIAAATTGWFAFGGASDTAIATEENSESQITPPTSAPVAPSINEVPGKPLSDTPERQDEKKSGTLKPSPLDDPESSDNNEPARKSTLVKTNAKAPPAAQPRTVRRPVKTKPRPVPKSENGEARFKDKLRNPF